MFGISLKEFILIILLMVIILKPEDIPKVVNFLARCFRYVNEFLTSVSSKIKYMTSELQDDVEYMKDRFHDNTKQIKLDFIGEPDFFDLAEDDGKKTPKLNIKKEQKTLTKTRNSKRKNDKKENKNK